MRKHFRESSRNFPGRNGPGRKTTGRAGPGRAGPGRPALVVARTGRAGPGWAEKCWPVLSSTWHNPHSILIDCSDRATAVEMHATKQLYRPRPQILWRQTAEAVVTTPSCQHSQGSVVMAGGQIMKHTIRGVSVHAVEFCVHHSVYKK
jgi:hypothetical protein